MITKQIRNISIFLLFLLLINSFSAIAQAEIIEPAEIVATIKTQDNKIPSIKVSEWTSIYIEVKDAFGINWGDLSSRLPFRANFLWKVIHPGWRPFLGYTSIRFEPEIVEGNPHGWEFKPLPTISKADQGRIYNLTLELRTNDISVDYSVVVGIKVTRVNVFGEDFGESYIYIPVKASSLNNIKMDTPISTKEAPPRSITNFDVTVKNFGYYRDMFQLEFVHNSDMRVLSSDQIFALDPDESQNIRISVLTPEKFYDFGTPNTIDVYATSETDPTRVLVGSIVVITKGAYISPLIGIILAPIIIILILIYFIFFYRKKKREQELFVKPEKPWNIPVEKKHLEELKQKDKEAYEKERLMMEDEYKSAMLWYNSYLQSIRQEKRKEKSKQLNSKVTKFFKKPEKKKEKSKEKEKQPKKEKKPVEKVEKTIKEEKIKETPEIVKEQYKTIQEKSEEMQQRKEKALLKIKHAQEKQKRKIKK